MTLPLRTSVIALAVGAAALVLALASIPIVVLLHNKAYAEAEQQATYAAQSAADYLSTGNVTPSDLTPYLTRLNSRDTPAVTVLLDDGTRLGAPLNPAVSVAVAQRSAPHLTGDHDKDNLGQVSSAYDDDVPGGHVVQVFCQGENGITRVVATVTDSQVRATLWRQYLIVGGVGVALLLLAWLAAEVTGRRITRPLQRTARTALALSSGDLEARAPTTGPPEVARVAVELNALAARIGELLTQERESAADLSHRLRTPLTAVRLSLDALAPGPQRDEVETQVDALERTLTRVIRAARQGVRQGLHPRCDATEVTRQKVAFWRPLAEDQQRQVTLDLPDEPLWVRSTPDDLGAGIDALIENVVAHTPEGTAFGVTVTPAAYGADLLVHDEGPGIPASAVVRGRSDRGSTGLGLDIARGVAQATGGDLDLVAGPPSGVRLRLYADEDAVLLAE